MPAVTVEDGVPLDGVAEQWEHLAAATQAGPFVRPGWIRAWHESFGRGELLVRAARRGTRLVGVLATDETEGEATSPTNWDTPSWEPLAEDADALAALARSAVRNRKELVHVAYLPAGGAGAEAFAAAAAESRRLVVRRTIKRSPVLALEGDRAWVEGTLGKEFRKSLRRNERRLEAAGRVTVEVTTDPERLSPALAEAFAIEATGWKAAGGTAIASSPATRSFYESVARWAAERGWLRLAFLRVDGVPAAFEYDLELEGAIHSLKAGFDRRFATYSPGNVLILRVLSDAWTRGVRRYEFGGSDEPYKLRWASEVDTFERIYAYRRTPVGLARWATLAYLRPLAARLRTRAAS